MKKSSLKKYLKIIFWPFVLMGGQLLLIVLFTFFFNIRYISSLKEQYPNLTNIEIKNKFNEILSSNQYVQELNSFLVDYNIVIIIILTIIILPILVKKYHENYQLSKKQLQSQDYVKIMLFSIFLAFVLNLLFYLVNNIFPYTNRYLDTSTRLSTIITTGILVPILEEYIFRGVVYNELKTFNSKKVSIILTTVFFALMHMELSQMLYAFIVGLYLITLYDRVGSIKVSICSHILINLSTIILIPIITSVNILVQLLIVIILVFGFYHNLCIKKSN